MHPLRSAARSSLARALLLLVVVAQQFGALSHGAMLARADLRAPMLHDVCSSAGWAREPGEAEPLDAPTSPGATCDLCATATMAALCGPASAATAKPRVLDDAPVLASSVLLASLSQGAYQSRAPPASFLV